MNYNFLFHSFDFGVKYDLGMFLTGFVRVNWCNFFSGGLAFEESGGKAQGRSSECDTDGEEKTVRHLWLHTRTTEEHALETPCRPGTALALL